MAVNVATLSAIASAVVAFCAGWKYSSELDKHFGPCSWGIHVVDGDTIKCHGRSIRLDGFDTPEIHRASCKDEEALGHYSKRRLEQLLARGSATILLVGEDGGYGRWLGRARVDGHDVSEILISDRLAQPLAGGKRKRIKGTWC